MTAPETGHVTAPPRRDGEPAGRSGSLVESYLARNGLFAAGADQATGDQLGRYDEMTGADGGVLPGWSELAAELEVIGRDGLGELAGRVDRLLEDDGVTYTPVTPVDAAGAADVAPAEGAPRAEQRTAPVDPEHWRLDPLPLVVADAEWTRLEAGLIQRSTLLDAVLTDLYGPRGLIDNGLLPPEVIFGHPDYLRPAHGITIPGAHQLFFHAVDVYRAPSGEFQALGDRTQAPSGAGYAMADRRVISRVLPDLYRRHAPRGLGAFFHTMRSALASVAPHDADDPRIVVLSPGTHSETAFDQAMLASLLGVPLVETADLTVRRGRLWMLSMGRFEPVDVVVRRVDAVWSDPLDLDPGSRLGVVGLTEACRRGAVTVVNTLGSGVLESPALAPYLPKLARAVLGETLKLPSVPSFWCGEESARSHVVANLEQMVLRPTCRDRSVFPALLSRAERDLWRARLAAEPTKWVGQQAAPFSEAPMAVPQGLAAGEASLRLFTVAHGSGYVAMPGSLGRVQHGDPATGTRSSLAKDVWVRSGRGEAQERREGRVWLYEGPVVAAERPESTSSPRVLEDMFWLGRYAERTEDLTRLLIVARERVDDFRFRPEHLGAGCVPVLLAAVTEVIGTTAGFDGSDPSARIVELMADAAEPGTVAQSLAGLREAARAVRDQLSADTWMVLGATDRAVASLADDLHHHHVQVPNMQIQGRHGQVQVQGFQVQGSQGQGLQGQGLQGQGLQAQGLQGHSLFGRDHQDTAAVGPVLAAAQASVLSGMLALAGLVSENMIRDPGWYFLDLGRRLERAQQVTALLRSTLTTSHSSAVDSLVVESVLAAGESGVTYRRRYRGRIQVATMVELLLLDTGNPRSVAYQVAQARADLRALPDSSGTSRPQRKVEDLEGVLRRVQPAELDRIDANGQRPDLQELLQTLHDSLRELADVIAAHHFPHPSQMQQLGVRTAAGARG